MKEKECCESHGFKDKVTWTYIPDTDEIVEYDLMISDEKYLFEYKDNPKWVFLGCGYAVYTTLENKAESTLYLSYFFRYS